MVLRKASAALIADAEILYEELLTFVISNCRFVKCVDPEGCATSITSDCLTPSRSKSGRVVARLGKKKIYVYDPQAEDQRSYLFGRGRVKAFNQRSRCAECRLAGVTCPYADGTPYTGADEPRLWRADPPSPALGPEDTYRQKELIERARAAASSEQQKIMDGLLLGFNYVDIAEWLQKTPEAIRQSMLRLRRKLKP